MRPAEQIRRWKTSPLLFVTDAIRAVPSKQQADALMKLPKTKRLSIRSGHGTGKDAFAAWTILWFMSTRTYPHVPCTAPTARQLSDILWSELSKWLRKSILTDEFVLQKDKMFHKDAPKEWWVRAISPSVRASKEDQQETLAGLHADHQLIIVDEASGVLDPVYIPLEGAMTQEDNMVILIGNMTKNTGYFYDTHFHPNISKQWTKLHWDSRDSENVSPGYVQYMLEKYGEESNVFRIRVTGDPPTDDEMSLIPLHWAIACVGNEIEESEDEPLYLAVDVARYGDDKSIILPRRHLTIYPWESFQGMNIMDLAARVYHSKMEQDASGIGIDGIGVGGGVADYLYKTPGGRQFVTEVNTSSASSNKTKYRRLRDELWIAMRDKCMAKMYSFPDVTMRMAGGIDINLGHELANELAGPTYNLDNGYYIVESKPKMKLRGLKSPNIADALAISEYFYGVAYNMWNKVYKIKPKKSKARVYGIGGKRRRGKRSQNWMTA